MPNLSLSLSLYIYIYIEREREREKNKSISNPGQYCVYITQEDFHWAFEKLLERYKCIAAGGDYFEAD